jgi:hypothetical protein
VNGNGDGFNGWWIPAKPITRTGSQRFGGGAVKPFMKTNCLGTQLDKLCEK